MLLCVCIVKDTEIIPQKTFIVQIPSWRVTDSRLSVTAYSKHSQLRPYWRTPRPTCAIWQCDISSLNRAVYNLCKSLFWLPTIASWWTEVSLLKICYRTLRKGPVVMLLTTTGLLHRTSSSSATTGDSSCIERHDIRNSCGKIKCKGHPCTGIEALCRLYGP